MENMNTKDIIRDFANRPLDAANRLPQLSPDQLNAHLGDHPNSIAWLLWHTGREIDIQLSDLTGAPQQWEAYRDRFGLGEIGDSIGFGHTTAQAESIVVDDQQLLVDYLGASMSALTTYTDGLSEGDLDEVIDANWNPPVTLGVRLVSIIDDAIQHVAQAAYVAGALSRQ